MRIPTVLIGASLALAAAGATRAQSVEVRDAVARVVVIPEARSDIRVDVVSANPRLPLNVRRSGGKTIIDGKLGRRIRGCDGDGAAARVRVMGVGEVGHGQMPQVIIRTPRDVHVTAGGAVFGSVGRAASVELGNAGCGDWLVGNVEGLLHISELGSGDLRAGGSGQARLRLAGSGDIDAGVVRGPVQVDLGGSGDVTVQAVNGAMDVKVAGSGDVEVKGGKAPVMNASVAGSGSVTFGGVAETLKVRVAGSGDISVSQVTGPISRSVIGSGELRVGGREVARRP